MERDAWEMLVRLEERVTALREDMVEVRSDVSKLRRQRLAAESIARDATARHARALRNRELVLGAAGLALTAVNVAVSVWS